MNTDKTKPGFCQHCGEPLRVTRTIPKLGGLPELRMFRCDECGRVASEEVEEPKRLH